MRGLDFNPRTYPLCDTTFRLLSLSDFCLFGIFVKLLLRGVSALYYEGTEVSQSGLFREVIT